MSLQRLDLPGRTLTSVSNMDSKVQKKRISKLRKNDFDSMIGEAV